MASPTCATCIYCTDEYVSDLIGESCFLNRPVLRDRALIHDTKYEILWVFCLFVTVINRKPKKGISIRSDANEYCHKVSRWS